MMGLGWDAIQKLGSKGLVIDVPVVQLGQTSKTADTVILPAVAANNQPVPRPTGGADSRKLSLNEVVLGLVSGNVCAEALPSITSTVVHALEIDGDSALRD